MAGKNISKMTYFVSNGTQNLNSKSKSLQLSLWILWKNIYYAVRQHLFTDEH